MVSRLPEAKKSFAAKHVFKRITADTREKRTARALPRHVRIMQLDHNQVGLPHPICVRHQQRLFRALNIDFNDKWCVAFSKLSYSVSTDAIAWANAKRR